MNLQIKIALALQLHTRDYKTLKQVRFLFLLSDLNLPYFPKSNFLLKITIIPLSEEVFVDILGSVEVLPKMFSACSLRHFYIL